MRILQINSVCGFGSTGRIATDLYKIYEEAGHECVIAYGRGNAPDGYKTIKIGSDVDNYLHIAKTRILDKHGFGSKRATEKLIEEVKKFNPDIIHLHNIHGYYVDIEILFKYLKESNKKVIWTLHDCWSFTGHCSHFDYIDCERWKEGCFNCPQKIAYPSSKILDNSRWNYQKKKELFTGIKDMTIITPSKWLANLVKESFLGESKIKVINNGIDTEIFKPTPSNFREEYNIGNKKIILGVASIWSKGKGYKYFEELAKKLDSNKYQIVLVGKMNKNQINSMPKEIIWIKQTNSTKELAKIYTVADIFFNPTLEDNFPTVNLESLSCGTPVYTFDTGGSAECINTNTGIVLKKEKKDYFDKLQNLKNFYFNIEKEIKKYDKERVFKYYLNL